MADSFHTHRTCLAAADDNLCTRDRCDQLVALGVCGQSSALPLHLLVLLVALPDAVLLQQPLVLLLSGQKIIRNARIENVGKYQSCMVSKL